MNYSGNAYADLCEKKLIDKNGAIAVRMRTEKK